MLGETVLSIRIDAIDKSYLLIASTTEDRRETTHTTYNSALTEALRALVREQAWRGRTC